MQVHKWKESKKDFFYFCPATQMTDLNSDDDTTGNFADEDLSEDDILYNQLTTFEGDQGNTLLFVHQSVEQLAVLKRLKHFSGMKMCN